MTYLIYEDDELIDVMDFDTIGDITAYQKLNPLHRLEPETDLEKDFLLLDEDEVEEIDDDLPF